MFVGQKPQVENGQDRLYGQKPIERNWILVVDKIVLLQTSGGEEYVYVEESLLPVLTQVLDLIQDETHIQP
ncbi:MULTISPECIES: hypothetical protein [Sphingobacterium]|uniref:hypothetical protein n=1 Tax=Sphingobacterium TaxID=28453 RepID=UPI0013DAE9DB|nr:MULTISPECIES: hypothetical protein [unclassified Sphingobacterium]